MPVRCGPEDGGRNPPKSNPGDCGRSEAAAVTRQAPEQHILSRLKARRLVISHGHWAGRVLLPALSARYSLQPRINRGYKARCMTGKHAHNTLTSARTQVNIAVSTSDLTVAFINVFTYECFVLRVINHFCCGAEIHRALKLHKVLALI